MRVDWGSSITAPIRKTGQFIRAFTACRPGLATNKGRFAEWWWIWAGHLVTVRGALVPPACPFLL